MAIPRRIKNPVCDKQSRNPTRTRVSAFIQQLSMLLMAIFTSNNGEFRTTPEIRSRVRTLGRLVGNPHGVIDSIKSAIVSRYHAYWEDLNNPDTCELATYYESAHTTLLEILSFIEGIPNTFINQFENHHYFIVPFLLNSDKFDEEKANEYDGKAPETIAAYDIGFTYFEDNLIFIHKGIYHIRFGYIKRYLTKMMNQPKNIQIGFMIAIRLYLENGDLIGSPFDFYNVVVKESENNIFPFFEDIHPHFYKDHSTCPCNQQDHEGEFIEPTRETTVEKFALKEILYLVSGIIYHNSNSFVDDKIEPNGEFVQDFLGPFTVTIEELDAVAN